MGSLSTQGIDQGLTVGPTLVEKTPKPMLSVGTSKVTTEGPETTHFMTTQVISVSPTIGETPKPMTSSTATSRTMSSEGTTKEPSLTNETPKPMPSTATTKTTASTDGQNISNPLGSPISLSTLEKTTSSTGIQPTTASSTGETPRPMRSSSTGLVLAGTTSSGITFGGSKTPMPMTGTAIPMLETPLRMS